MIMANQDEVDPMSVKDVEDPAHGWTFAVLSGAVERPMKVGDGAELPAGREIPDQPRFLLSRLPLSRAKRRQLTVQRDHVPLPKVEAVVSSSIRSRTIAEVCVVRDGAARVVIVVPRRWTN